MTRYIFVEMLAGNPKHSIYNINNTIGVSTVVYCGYEALSVPVAIINELRGRADANGEIPDESSGPRVFPGKVGDRVKFLEGSPFFGFMAEIRRIDTTGKLMIELDQMLGSQREILVNQTDVGEIVRG